MNCSPLGTRQGGFRRDYGSMWFLILSAVFCMLLFGGELYAAVDFNREVRPILAKNCLACHGPDAEAREAKLRLDTFAGATMDLGGTQALVPGDVAKSELIYRVEATDPDEIMPPPKSAHTLTDAEKSTLRQWVLEGGTYQEHWAFVPPEKGPLPESTSGHMNWARKPLDHFILQGLEAKDLAPSPDADRRTWLRRVSLDLTGLPPSLEALDAFLADRSDKAVANVVDRLLASPAYGEHWARMWLDLARYADTKGYEKDKHREIWPYRDWLIDALNRDLPYDQFTIEQLAGDLLPAPTMEQLVATAFHRNTMTNDEGGTDDEEFRIAAVKDRVDTTMQVWMGLTMGCAKCHDHKYDPLTQQEYYQFLAFFNQTEDADRSNDSPIITVENAALLKRKAALSAAIKQARDGELPALKKALLVRSTLSQQWAVMVPQKVDSAEGASLKILPDHSVLAGGKAPERDVYTLVYSLPVGQYRTLRLDALTDPSLGDRSGPGRNPKDPNFVLNELSVERIAADGITTQVVAIASARADFEQNGWPVKNAFDGQSKTGWAVSPQFGKDHLACFVLDQPLEIKAGDQVRIRMIQQYGNRLLFGRVRWSAGTADTAKWSMADLQVAQALALGEDEAWSSEQLTHVKNILGVQSGAEINQLEKELASLKKPQATVPVMKEKAAGKQRVTHIHLRGNFLDPGEQVTAGLPAAFPGMPTGAQTNRLGVAQWLVAADNPLTARVMVNRVWARLFGVGLVETEEDFGVQGLMPSHAELLDWLAVDFREQGWSMKQLLRDLVLSRTYGQEARVRDEQLAVDPRNRLFGRGPRFRLSAEMVRDQALAVSGLLTQKVGGPSVMPPQPAGVWKTTYNGGDWKNAVGPDRYRRGLYTYLKRTSPYPAMTTFDAGSGEVCQIRRLRTNTPLQALITLNDPAFVEAAGALAARMTQAGAALEEKIALGYRLVLLRDASDQEKQRLIALYKTLKEEIADGDALIKSAGQTSGDPALIGVANVLLNLDETIMKP